MPTHEDPFGLGPRSPCGCNDAEAGELAFSAEGAPTAAELETALTASLSSDASVQAGTPQALEAALDDVLSAAESGAETDGSLIQNLVALLERYPGLRVSLSYG